MARYIFTNKKYDIKSNQETYDKFLKFQDIFFNNGMSIFSDSLNLFDNDEVFLEFEKRIIDGYDSSDKKSIEKYEKQLKDASLKTKHFFANLVWLYSFSIYDMKPETKKNEIITYLEPCEYSEKLLNEFIPKNGFASYGSSKMHKYFSICYIYFFVKSCVKSRPKNKKEYIDILNSIKVGDEINKNHKIKVNSIKSVPPFHMLKFLFNPDYYEPIINTTGKKKIVKHFLKLDDNKLEDNKLDDYLYSIRQDTFGFENSIYAVLYTEGRNKYKVINVSKINDNNINSNFSFSLTPNITSKSERIESYQGKLENGEKAEELVYQEVLKCLTNSEKEELIILLKERFAVDYKLDDIEQNIDKIIHYSKNFNNNAPFDLITYVNQDILFIEVKSTLSNQIYFTKNEILFAFENKENYEVRVVKNNLIYVLDLENTIDQIFEFIKNQTSGWNSNNFVLTI
ncbi:protein NO VEIN domain-containing protein [Aliarcobacter cryaerophilus]|uniref:protein NO VEIN domain-containing protein n=1 Tax=Aliarcobacter cryaerophilus TaxID=28198 RepID=UPI0008264735|nr:DUF3883 domain-containing protein [Aliarcobacter cryaerophilus]